MIGAGQHSDSTKDKYQKLCRDACRAVSFRILNL